MNKKIHIQDLEQWDVFFMDYNGHYEKFVVLNILENEGYLIRQLYNKEPNIFLSINNTTKKELFYHKHLGLLERILLWFTDGLSE